MSPRKPIHRAVLEERLKVLEEARAKRRKTAVSIGVYFALTFGVLVSQAITLSDDLMSSFQPFEIGQLIGGWLVSMIVYSKIEGTTGELSGKAKKGNVGRVLLTAFSHGMMWMNIVGFWG